ncbi:MAG: MopE-related protein [Pseudomonadota bacterium]|nr:MopE-related protein [Pseudomonadota bacterium]
MLLLLATASAAGLPWECPALDAPPDAPQFRTDAGLDDTFTLLSDLQDAWVEADCVWSEVLLDTGALEATCTTSVGALLTLTRLDGEATGEIMPNDRRTWSNWALTVELPEGLDTWTRLDLSSDEGSLSSGAAWGADTSVTAVWTGAVLDLPDDASFTLGTSYSCFYSDCYRNTTIDTSTCDWSWGSSDGDGQQWASSGGHRAAIFTYWHQCGAYPTQAWYDDALYGHVDTTTWILDEADRDGWSVADGDCDDTDPAIYPCARDIVADGIDQDCDGADSLDGDGDGDPYDTDCDDANGLFHAHADDTPGDGLDQDCDGADDVDADADGYTADGDDREADCDEDDDDFHPGAADLDCDGLDQDCDGEDDCAEPEPPPAESDSPPPTGSAGCGGGSAALLLVGALLLRPRRRSRV